jgi:hypothetical protein
VAHTTKGTQILWTCARVAFPLAEAGACLSDTKTLIEQAYSAFNKRDIDGALALMTQDVSWPVASAGGKVVGKEEIRAYWTRQWGEFDPYVEPLAMTEEDGGKTRVRMHQLVKACKGMFFRLENPGTDGTYPISCIVSRSRIGKRPVRPHTFVPTFSGVC